MANDIGDRAMIAACGGDIELRRQLTARPNAHERALWLFGRDPERLGGRTRSVTRTTSSAAELDGFIGPRGAWPR